MTSQLYKPHLTWAIINQVSHTSHSFSSHLYCLAVGCTAARTLYCHPDVTQVWAASWHLAVQGWELATDLCKNRVLVATQPALIVWTCTAGYLVVLLMGLCTVSQSSHKCGQPPVQARFTQGLCLQISQVRMHLPPPLYCLVLTCTAGATMYSLVLAS